MKRNKHVTGLFSKNHIASVVAASLMFSVPTIAIAAHPEEAFAEAPQDEQGGGGIISANKKSNKTDIAINKKDEKLSNIEARGTDRSAVNESNSSKATKPPVDTFYSVNPNTGIGAKDATGDYTFVSTFGLTDKTAKERLLKFAKRHIIIGGYVTGNLFNVGGKVSNSVGVNLFKPRSEARIRAKVRTLPDDTAIKFEPDLYDL